MSVYCGSTHPSLCKRGNQVILDHFKQEGKARKKWMILLVTEFEQM